MTGLGYVLIGAGFLAGSLVAVQTVANEVSWVRYIPALFVGFAGTVLTRVARRRSVGGTGAFDLEMTHLGQSLNRILIHARKLEMEAAHLHPNDVHDRIDQLFRQDLEIFVDARLSIARRFGLQAYAEVMNEFAAGERYLNRVWSASVDGYVDEVRDYLGHAKHQFEKADAALRRWTKPPAD